MSDETSAVSAWPGGWEVSGDPCRGTRGVGERGSEVLEAVTGDLTMQSLSEGQEERRQNSEVGGGCLFPDRA